jgi:hypothetical protein
VANPLAPAIGTTDASPSNREGGSECETETTRPEPAQARRSVIQLAAGPTPDEDTEVEVQEDRKPARPEPGRRAAQRRRRRRERALPPNAKHPWVSKTQFLLYLRCPYAFFQIDAGYVAPAVMIDELGERLIEEGIEFEQSVTSTAVPLQAGVDFE